jgi:hypothetical protein
MKSVSAGLVAMGQPPQCGHFTNRVCVSIPSRLQILSPMDDKCGNPRWFRFDTDAVQSPPDGLPGFAQCGVLAAGAAVTKDQLQPVA